MTLKESKDIKVIKHEILSENIMMIKFATFVSSDIESVKDLVEELRLFSSIYCGDVVLFGDERTVMTLFSVKIWGRS